MPRITFFPLGNADTCLIELDNGEIWQQIDNSRLPLGRGEDVRILASGPGMQMLEKVSGSRRIRVKLTATGDQGRD